jgi:VanZ family protein
MKKKQVIEIIRRVLIVLIVLWMITVFILSNQNGESSGGLSLAITKFLFKNEQIAEKMDPFIRKCAHMAEYAYGAILIYAYCLTYEKMNSKKQILFTICVTVLYAITDELHQLFVNERAGQITDVLIDAVGSVIGIGLVWIATRLVRGTEYGYLHPDEVQEERDLREGKGGDGKSSPLSSVTISVKDLKKKIEKGDEKNDKL